MKLGMVYNSYFTKVGEDYFWAGPEQALLEGFASSFDQTIIWARVNEHDSAAVSLNLEPKTEWRLALSQVEIHELPASDRHRGFLRGLRKQWRAARILWREMGSCDALFVTVPSLPSVSAWLINKTRLAKPLILYVRGEWPKVVLHNLPLFWGRVKGGIFAVPYARLVTLAERLMMRDAVFRLVDPANLLIKYEGDGKPIMPVIGAHLKPEEFYYREDTCQSDALKLLFVGSLIPRKGLPILFDSLLQLRSRGTPVQLTIVGSGPLEQPLRTLAGDLGIIGQIDFEGHVSNRGELFRLYQQSDILVLPSYSEGFPRVIVEAMSQGLPVIATKVGGIPHRLGDEVHALLVPPGSARELASAIEKMMADGELRRSLIHNGYEFVAEAFSKDPGQQLVEALRQHCPSLFGIDIPVGSDQTEFSA